jgi:hypothetical protein
MSQMGKAFGFLNQGFAGGNMLGDENFLVRSVKYIGLRCKSSFLAAPTMSCDIQPE